MHLKKSIIARKYWAGLYRLIIPGTQGQETFKFQAKLGYMVRPYLGRGDGG